ncbi:MAG: hypothetical protein ACHQ01_02665 [Candidatus Limnocylindrales bacterium]
MGRGWWSARIHRTWTHVHGRVADDERAELSGWLGPVQLSLFDGMPANDRRHGLDVVAYLRAAGVTDTDLLVAGLLHDCGKGRQVRLVHRVAWSLGQRYGEWIWRAGGRLPTFEMGLGRLRDHAVLSADMAAKAGCTPRTIDLIRNQETPTDDAGRLLLDADEAS